MAGGEYTHPGSTEQLMHYWAHGEGAAKIGWGVAGDFDRCVLHLSKYVRPDEVKGLCSNLHVKATGARPGHAPGEAADKHRSVMADTKKPYGDVTYADPGHQKDNKKRYPIDTEAHAKAAWSYINQPGNASAYSAEQLAAIKGRIKAALKRFGVTVSEDTSSSSSRDEEFMPAREFARTWDLTDVTVRQDGGGRIVQAFITPFDHPTEISDQDGHYEEKVTRGAFTKTLAERGLNFTVLFNHGRTFDGRTDGALMMPIGVPRVLEQQERGLYSETEYLDNPLADAALDAVKKGALRGYSFTGRFVKSVRTRGQRSTGILPTIIRSEVAMREYGPVLFPAYEAAQIVGHRMADLIGQMDPEDVDRLREILGVPTRLEPVDAFATPPGAGITDDPPVGQSNRLLSQRIRMARIIRGME